MSRMTASTAIWLVELDRRGGDFHGDDPAAPWSGAALARKMPVVQLALKPLLNPAANSGSSIWLGVHRQQFFARVAQQPAGGRIGVEDSALLIVDEHRVVDAVEEGPARRSDATRAASDCFRALGHDCARGCR